MILNVKLLRNGGDVALRHGRECLAELLLGIGLDNEPRDFITQSKTGRGLANVKKTDIQQASWMDDVHKAASYLQDIAEIGPSHVMDQYLDKMAGHNGKNNAPSRMANSRSTPL